jgi:hypothetical protein
MGNIISSILAQWQPHNLPRLAAQLPPDTNLALYFDCGMQDEVLFYPANMAFADSLDSLGILYEFQSFSGGHSNLFLTRVPISLAFLDSVINTGIEEHKPSQAVTTLLQIRPNPFRNKVNITFSTECNTKATAFTIYDATGRAVKECNHLVNNRIIWDGTDNLNRTLRSGVYFVKLKTRDHIATEKLLLIR